ncbi:hypothetical protein O9992_17340 [Vibrio lentus]|nr:hypothetical protein [Vibrio lentus]
MSDFNHAAFIGPSDYQDIISMLKRRGLSLTTESFPVTTSNHTVYWELVKQGVGIGFFKKAWFNLQMV